MRITWFGGSTFRLYLGGNIVVVDPDAAPAGIDRAELAAAADRTIAASGEGLPVLDTEWKPRRRRREIDEPESRPPLRIFRLEGGGVLLDAAEKSPLVLGNGETAWGSFAENSVVVLHGPGENIPEAALRLLAAARPRLIALAGIPSDAAFSAIAAAIRDTPFQVLETGLALEA